MPKEKFPVTPAIRVLREACVDFEPHLYNYEERGGTAASARALGVSEHAVVKTLIMEDESKNPLVALMHGDCEVSTKNLARILGVKSIVPCAPATADRHSGYQVGGTSPFGTRKQMPVFIQETILALEHIYINGGKRGFLVKIDPKEAARVLGARALSMKA
jgi:Cys-tRNA(Pro) deacylase